MDHLIVPPNMTSLRVRAELAGGIAQGAPWGIALDGLLAAQMWTAAKASLLADAGAALDAVDANPPPDLDLPLARCDAGEDWHWAATCAFPDPTGDNGTEVRYWTSRFDYRHDELVVADEPSGVSDRQGRYRARRMPLIVSSCNAVVWRCVGDARAIEELLRPVVSIGKKRNTGEGHVLGWDVVAVDDDPWDAAHLHPDGTLGRPTPMQCVAEHRAADGGEGIAGIRPPYMHASRQRTLRLPAFLD